MRNHSSLDGKLSSVKQPLSIQFWKCFSLETIWTFFASNIMTEWDISLATVWRFLAFIRTVECVIVLRFFSSFWSTRKGCPLSRNYLIAQIVSLFPPSQLQRALTKKIQVKTWPASLFACPHLFVKWPHCSLMDYYSFISSFCFPLTTVEGNSFSSCLLNMVKAIMCQVHGPIWELHSYYVPNGSPSPPSHQQ